MSLGPVVSRPGLAKHKVVGPEDLAKWARPDRVHGAGLEVHQDSPGDVLAHGLIVVDINAFQLEGGVTLKEIQFE